MPATGGNHLAEADARNDNPVAPVNPPAPAVNHGTTSDPPVKITPASPAKTPAIDMILIEPGEFWMGSLDTDPQASDDEKPRHKVKITQPFSLGKTKITQAEYEDVTGNNPSAFRPERRARGKDTGQNPVESIGWHDAIRFCNLLSERHGLAPYYQIDGTNVQVLGGIGYRLPTEAEWEFACRAGTTTRWYFGDNPADLKEHAWFDGDSFQTTHPVATKKANPWGLFDMHGNVSEWCWDRYDPTYYKRSPVADPTGSSQGETRVHRGGAWNMAAAQTRGGGRDARLSVYTGALAPFIGMRVARNVNP